MYEGRRLIVFFCMHRSGSSLTTNVLQRLGMSLGPFPLMGANEYNKHGHFESMAFYEVDKDVQQHAFGFSEDLPQSAEVLRRFLACRGRWAPAEPVAEALVERGRELVQQLVASAPISGFKDPRVPLIWPYWRQVLSAFKGLQVVLVVLARSPHEIAMSIFRRGRGAIRYQDALEVTAIHYERMAEILESWEGDRALVRFDLSTFADDLQQAAAVCGLEWSTEALEEVYDASCKHHDPAIVAHPAQQLFERIAQWPSRAPTTEDYARVEHDTAMREALLHADLTKYCEDAESRRRENEHLLTRIEQSTQELRRLQEELDRSRKEWTQASEELQQTRLEHQHALRQVGQIGQAHEQARREIDESRQLQERLGLQIVRLQKESEEHQQQIAPLREQLEQSWSENERYRQRTEDLLGQIEQLELENAQSYQVIDALRRIEQQLQIELGRIAIPAAKRRKPWYAIPLGW